MTERKKRTKQANAIAPSLGKVYETELLERASLKPHPKNYRTHPEDQLRHIGESLKQNGFYRNVVIAKDNTILAGHGVIEAAALVGITKIPCYRLPIESDSPSAMKILASDNELPRFAESDDRALSEILRGIALEDPSGLLGTGYEPMMLANLVMVTRPASEISDFNAAAEWLGMPEYESGEDLFKLTITFRTIADRAQYVKEQGIKIDKIVGVSSWSTRWPWTDQEDASSIRFVTNKPATKSKTLSKVKGR
jgi:hypothetical protein